MMRWLIDGIPEDNWFSIIDDFIGDVPLQLLYVAGDIDEMLIGTEGDRALAFTRYNAGPSAIDTNPAYKAYGIPVAHCAAIQASGTDCC